MAPYGSFDAPFATFDALNLDVPRRRTTSDSTASETKQELVNDMKLALHAVKEEDSNDTLMILHTPRSDSECSLFVGYSFERLVTGDQIDHQTGEKNLAKTCPPAAPTSSSSASSRDAFHKMGTSSQPAVAQSTQEKVRRFCFNCGKPVQPEFRFCVWCGASFQRMIPYQ
jgi:hypothetical protein